MLPATKAEFSAMPVTIPGQRDRQDEEERDRLPPEEAEAVDAEGSRRAEDERDAGGDQPDPDATATARLLTSAFQAARNHFVVNAGIGQLCTFDLLNA